MVCLSSTTHSGCLNDPGAEGGIVEATETNEPPNASVTEASDDRISDVGPVQEALQRAKESDTAGGEVSEREYDDVARALSELPWYDRRGHDSSQPYRSGIYIRYEDSSYVVGLLPYCTGSPIRKAQSERGEYGWGGCIER